MYEDQGYQLYEKLGDEYIAVNQDQAYLCYEHAEFLCEDALYRQVIKAKKDRLLGEYSIQVRKTSIVIVSYNCMYLMQKCLESIRKYCNSEAYEIVVVDNDSTDGVREWLQQQSDIKLILCNENAGFPLGCNIGIQYTTQENDIFLLNNDTRMTPGALFWLRMGLYERNDVGAVGCVANYCGNDQQIEIEFPLPDDYIQYGDKINVPCDYPYEEKNRLCGFAMMIRRSVADRIGGMDINFSPGYFDDDDLSVRIGKEGYRMVVCHNAFIYHAGSQSFAGKEGIEEIITRNLFYFLNKWNYDIITYSQPNIEAVLQLGREDKNKRIRILEIGAGSGNTLSKIKYLFPQAEVYGIEENEQAVSYGVKDIPIVVGNWRNMDIPFEKGYFDYIICTRSQSSEMREMKECFQGYLNENGAFL